MSKRDPTLVRTWTTTISHRGVNVTVSIRHIASGEDTYFSYDLRGGGLQLYKATQFDSLDAAFEDARTNGVHSLLR